MPHPAPRATRGTTTVEAAQQEFAPAGLYLNTASIGLPPRATAETVTRAVDRWATGELHPNDFDAAVANSRALFAELVGVEADHVAISSTTSALIALVAAALPDDAEVLLAAGEFTSVSFPFLAQTGRGVACREVPLDRLADEVTERTSLVAVAAAASADGALADLNALLAARQRHGCRLLIDLTQAAGWLSVDAAQFDYTVCAGYKWLLAPRGTAFMTIRPEHWDSLIPHAANWYAGDDIWTSIYGFPLRLAATARRFDISPAWFAWAGQEPSLELLLAVGPEAIGAHSVGLANRFRTGMGLPPGDSAIVSVPVDPAAQAAITDVAMQAAFRAGRLRVSFYLYNTESDADVATDVLRPFVIEG